MNMTNIKGPKTLPWVHWRVYHSILMWNYQCKHTENGTLKRSDDKATDFQLFQFHYTCIMVPCSVYYSKIFHCNIMAKIMMSLLQ